jgi:hypothetical protein
MVVQCNQVATKEKPEKVGKNGGSSKAAGDRKCEAVRAR